VCLSVGSTLVQNVLRSSLRLKLSGQDVDEVRCSFITDHDYVANFSC